MIIKNIFVEDLDFVIDFYISNLIKFNISYVLINNELHFSNYIFRFFKIVYCDDILDKIKSNLNDFSFYSQFEDYNTKNTRDNSIPKYSKSLIKKNNYMLNKKINNSKLNHF